MIRFFQRNPLQDRIPPSRFDNLLDGITFLFSFLAWVIGLTFIYKFDGVGLLQIKDVWLSLILFTLVLVCLVFGAYYPQIINNPFKYSVDKDCRSAQLRLVVWMARSCAVVLSVIFLSQIMSNGVELFGWNEVLFKIVVLIGIALLLVIQVVFFIRMWRIGSRFEYFRK